MPLTSLAQASLTSSALIIDCTQILDAGQDIHNGEAVSSLIRWVQAYPRRNEIQVYVGGRDRHRSRSLQGRLQALGCRVTTKHATYPH